MSGAIDGGSVVVTAVGCVVIVGGDVTVVVAVVVVRAAIHKNRYATAAGVKTTRHEDADADRLPSG